MKCSKHPVSKNTQDLHIQLLTTKGKARTNRISKVGGCNSYNPENIKVPTCTYMLVSIDIAIQVSPSTYKKIAPPLGLSVKNSIDIGAGVIDKDCRGPINICLINHFETEFLVQKGYRIA